MDPRRRPDPGKIGVNPAAFEETRRWGLNQRYKPDIADMARYWRYVRVHGLAPGLKHDRIFTLSAGERGEDWRLYILSIGTLYVGICESWDGSALRLLLVAPRASMSRSAVMQEALNRGQ